MSRRLSDVAKKVGVSEATVSRALNGKPGVSDATREAILTALDVLGYERPTKLRGERPRLVGLVVPELGNPIFPAFAEAIGGALAQQGLVPVLCTRTGGVTEADYVDLLLAQQVSGVIFSGGQYAEREADHAHYRRLAELGMPVVLVNATIEQLPFPRVMCDDDVAVELALTHLVSLGHERVGLLLGPDDHVPSERKLLAARRVADELGIAIDDGLVVRTQYSLESGRAGASMLVERGATAIACASDPLALGAIRAVRRAGKTVPGDVSIVGYDDSALMTATDPALTTVRQPIDAMGRAVVELLTSLIGDMPIAQSSLLFEPELVVRASTGPNRLATT